MALPNSIFNNLLTKELLMISQSFTTKANTAHWSAVFSLFAGVTSLIAAEFIPVSLLTPIAQTMHISEGMAGQSVTAVGVFAFITSLILSPLTKSIDRRLVLLTLSVLLIISNLLVAMAPNYLIMMLGRCILGICVGGFWSMASAVTLQLVPTKDIPKALSIVYAGVSVATIISLPVASYLGFYIGWRNVFYLSALMSLAAFIWQFFALPSLPARPDNNFKNMFKLLKQRWVLAGIGGVIFSYAGYHIFFTYLRPFLDHQLTLPATTLSTVLLIFGIANCVGTFIAGLILGKFFKSAMLAVHFIFLSVAILLFISNGNVMENIGLIIVWGIMFGFIPVGWSTWITRTLADKAELAGGLSVAAIQFSIGFAAAIGGLIYDQLSIAGIFVAAIIIFSCALLLIKTSFSLFNKDTGNLA